MAYQALAQAGQLKVLSPIPENVKLEVEALADEVENVTESAQLFNKNDVIERE